jgi:hybrid cluster-associated redox disulfide protein
MGMKNTYLPTPEMLVDEVLRQNPQASHVFIAHRTDCVGCLLARFCTLAEVARFYGLHLETFLAEMQKYVESTPSHEEQP